MQKKTKFMAFALGFFIAGLSAYWYLAYAPSGPVPVGVVTPVPSGEGWIDLLDASHTAAWKNVGDDKDIFEIKDNELHIFGRTIYPLRYATYTAEKFTDFDLHVEFKLARRTNSGVFLRAQPNDPVHRGFEVQVLEDFGTPPNKNGCGAIYDVVSPMFNLSRPAGEWNSFDVHVQGDNVVVVVNGWKVVDTDFSKMTTPLGKFSTPYAQMQHEGNVALQDHGGECWYRNLKVKRL